MKVSEFKAWAAGFVENVEGPPSQKQWARFLEMMMRLQDEPETAVAASDRAFDAMPSAVSWGGKPGAKR